MLFVNYVKNLRLCGHASVNRPSYIGANPTYSTTYVTFPTNPHRNQGLENQAVQYSAKGCVKAVSVTNFLQYTQNSIQAS